ncbi:hypothetical protein P7L86_22770 [Vibrio parahaemolyticus]|nr:hypothetical protein [Vibrio parahaemolyticus]
MKKPFLINGFEGTANKLSGHGSIGYRLWLVGSELYVQIMSNNVNTPNSGSFSRDRVYSIGSYLDGNEIIAFSITDNQYVKDCNSNTRGFLKAITEHLLSGEEANE